MKFSASKLSKRETTTVTPSIWKQANFPSSELKWSDNKKLSEKKSRPSSLRGLMNTFQKSWQALAAWIARRLLLGCLIYPDQTVPLLASTWTSLLKTHSTLRTIRLHRLTCQLEISNQSPINRLSKYNLVRKQIPLGEMQAKMGDYTSNCRRPRGTRSLL